MKVFTFDLTATDGPFTAKRKPGGPEPKDIPKELDLGGNLMVDAVEVERIRKTCEACAIKGTLPQYNSVKAAVSEEEGDGVKVIFLHPAFHGSKAEF